MILLMCCLKEFIPTEASLMDPGCAFFPHKHSIVIT